MPMKPQGLAPQPLNARARTQAHQMVKEWRQHGLDADFVEYMPEGGEPGGYVLTVRNDDTMAVCLCQGWRQRRGLFGGREVWTISVTTREGEGEGQHAGVTAASDHREAWKAVIAWADDPRQHPLAPTLDEALRRLR